MKKYLALIVSIFILFCHQNCKPISDKPTMTQVPKENQIINLADENIQTVTLQSTENTTVQQSAKTFTLVSQNSYSVNYATGEISKTTQAGGAVVNYCLSINLLNELRDILNSAQVCKVETTNAPDQVCTMEYRVGYAQIMTSRDEIDLGSNSSGCGTKIDLCLPASADLLKGWFAAVKNQLPQLNCP